MALTFYMNGSSLTPKLSNSAWTNVLAPMNVTPTQSAGGGTGNISGGVIDCDHSSYGYNGFSLPAQGNVGTSNLVSMLIRAKIGTTASNQALISASGPNLQGCVRLHWLTGGTLGINVVNYAGSTLANATAAFSPSTGVYYDWFISADLSSTGANNVKGYVDGVLKAQATPSGTWSNPRLVNCQQLLVGIQATSGINQCSLQIDEIAVWDSIIDPTNVTLQSGAGSLNGASRTSLLAFTNFNGSNGYSRGRVVNR
jgi:hypothetical protein